LAANGFSGISSEGLASYEIDFKLLADRTSIVDLSYTITRDFVSTNPPPPGPGVYHGPQTFAAIGVFNLLLLNDRGGVYYPFESRLTERPAWIPMCSKSDLYSPTESRPPSTPYPRSTQSMATPAPRPGSTWRSRFDPFPNPRPLC